jgi:predicted nucleotidyltransferase
MKNFDIQKAREFVKKKEEKIREENHRRFIKACRDFNAILSMLISKYNPRHIYQWGSLLSEKKFSDIADIDIAVEGIESAEEYFRMIGDASELTDFPLDLVQIEKIDPVHAESIKKKGKLVYERA